MGHRKVSDEKYQHEIKIDVKVIRSNRETEIQEVWWMVKSTAQFTASGTAENIKMPVDEILCTRNGIKGQQLSRVLAGFLDVLEWRDEVNAFSVRPSTN